MTQEEKARAYDEAIKKAKEIKEKIVYSHLSTESCKTVSEYIDTIIPELAESEDERIRKDLIVEVRSWVGIPESKRRNYLAWLEKQKEQNPVEWNPTNEDVTLFNKAITTNTALTPTERAKIDIIRMKFKHCNGNIANPTEWSEEDERMTNRLIDRLNFIQYNTRTDGTSLNISFVNEIEWLKSLSSNLKKKNEDIAKLCSNEWSKEDEEMLDAMIDIVTNSLYEPLCPREGMLAWLKSLRNRPKTSDTWKPSEEQMEALQECGECKRCVKELYEQLKKL